MKRRILTALMSLSLVISLAVMPASAVADEIQPRYAGIVSVYSSINITSGGRADCSGDIELRSGYTADIYLILMRGNDPDFSELKTWTVENVSGKFDIDRSYYVLSGYDYCVVMSAIVYDETGKNIEAVDLFSGVQSY